MKNRLKRATASMLSFLMVFGVIHTTVLAEELYVYLPAVEYGYDVKGYGYSDKDAFFATPTDLPPILPIVPIEPASFTDPAELEDAVLIGSGTGFSHTGGLATIYTFPPNSRNAAAVIESWHEFPTGETANGPAGWTSLYLMLSDGSSVAVIYRRENNIASNNLNTMNRLALGRGRTAEDVRNPNDARAGEVGLADGNTANAGTQGGVFWSNVTGVGTGHAARINNTFGANTTSMTSYATRNQYIIFVDIAPGGGGVISFLVNGETAPISSATIPVTDLAAGTYVVSLNVRMENNSGTLHIPSWRVYDTAGAPTDDYVVNAADTQIRLLESESINVTVNVTTLNIPDGTYDITITPAVSGITAPDDIVIANNAGTITLSLAHTTEAIAHTLELSVDVNGEEAEDTFVLTVQPFVAPAITVADVTVAMGALGGSAALVVTPSFVPDGTFDVTLTPAVVGVSIPDDITFPLAAGAFLLSVAAGTPADEHDLTLSIDLGTRTITADFELTIDAPPGLIEPDSLPGIAWYSTPNHGIDFRGRTGVTINANTLASAMEGAVVRNADLMLGGGTSSNHAGFLMSNGGGRTMTLRQGAPNTAQDLVIQGPFRIDLSLARQSGAADVEGWGEVRLTPVGGGTQTIHRFYRDNSPTATAPTYHYFIYTGIGQYTVQVYPYRSGVSADAGRTGLRFIDVTLGEFRGTWINVGGVGNEHRFADLPFGYAEIHFEPLEVTIANVGQDMLTDAAITLSGPNDASFALSTNAIATIASGQSVSFTIAPVLGLPADSSHEATVTIEVGGVTESFDVSVTVMPIVHSVSTAYQFPNVLNEVIGWEHNFARYIFAPGVSTVLINNQLRDVDVSLYSPFMSEGNLMVPLDAAQRVLGSRIGDWSAVPSTDVSGVTFVPLNVIAQGHTNVTVGFDTRDSQRGAASNTLIITTGIAVVSASQGRAGIVSQHPAWYGSPNSINIATNLLTAQRSDGGFPRGLGQGDANQSWGSGNIGDWTQAQINNNWATTNNLDAYFGRGITTEEVRFMLMMYEATGIERFGASALWGLDTILNTQYQAGDTIDMRNQVGAVMTGEIFTLTPNCPGVGAWPYYITRRENHRGGASFSDNATVWILRLLMDIEDGNFSRLNNHTDSDRVQRATDAINLGIESILRLQIPSAAFSDGVERLTAWSLHMYPHTGHAMWAREFEPPTISGREGGWMLSFLMGLDSSRLEQVGPDVWKRTQRAIHDGAFFFNYTELFGHAHSTRATTGGSDRVLTAIPGASGLWARFICVETFNTLFSDRRTPTQPGGHAPYNNPFGLWPGPIDPYVRGGRLRSVYVDESGVMNTEGRGVFNLVASYANLSMERRNGFQYIGPFQVPLEASYAAWLARNGIERPFTPVREIADVAEFIQPGQNSRLDGNVIPPTATNRNITWSIVDAGDTGAQIIGDIILARDTGAVVVRATVENGAGIGLAFTQDFTVNVVTLIEVDEVEAVPNFLPIGSFNFNLAQALPINSTYRNIVWSVENDGGTGAVINGNTITTTSSGLVTVRATIANGVAGGDFTQNFDIEIDPDPTTPAIVPPGAVISNWRVEVFHHGGQAGANANIPPGEQNWMYISGLPVLGDRLYGDRGGIFAISELPQAFGDLGITSWIRTAMDRRNFGVASQSVFTVEVDMYIYVAFEQRTDRGRIWWVDDTWEFVDFGDEFMRSSEFQGDDLARYYFYRKHHSAGEIFRFGGIRQGTTLGQAVIFFAPGVQSIPEFVPVNNITGIPSAILTGDLTLQAIINPANTTNRSITWSIVDAGTTGASIAGDVLTAGTEGQVTIRATIAAGGAGAQDFTQDFVITVLENVIIDDAVMVIFEASNGGTLTAALVHTVENVPIASGGFVPVLSQVLFTAAPNSGFNISHWIVNGQAVQSTAATRTETVYDIGLQVSVVFAAVQIDDPDPGDDGDSTPPPSVQVTPPPPTIATIPTDDDEPIIDRPHDTIDTVEVERVYDEEGQPKSQTIEVELDMDELSSLLNQEYFNLNRIVAITQSGTILGGRIDPETGIFTFDTYHYGEITIAYVEDLVRLTLTIGSQLIVDEADNVPTILMDVAPFLQNGTTLLPIRFMAYAFGAEIGWNNYTSQVILTLDGQVLTFTAGDVLGGTATQIIDGRTMVSLRFIAEFFGAVVIWDDETQSIEIIR